LITISWEAVYAQCFEVALRPVLNNSTHLVLDSRLLCASAGPDMRPAA